MGTMINFTGQSKLVADLMATAAFLWYVDVNTAGVMPYHRNIRPEILRSTLLLSRLILMLVFIAFSEGLS